MNSTRRFSWRYALGLLATGVLRAQEPVSTVEVRAQRPWSQIKPVNGQCPVCGTQAQEYKKNGVDCDGLTAVSGLSMRFAIMGTGCEESRIIRCDNCSAAFWQDAVKE